MQLVQRGHTQHEEVVVPAVENQTSQFSALVRSDQITRLLYFHIPCMDFPPADLFQIPLVDEPTFFSLRRRSFSAIFTSQSFGFTISSNSPSSAKFAEVVSMTDGKFKDDDPEKQ